MKSFIFGVFCGCLVLNALALLMDMTWETNLVKYFHYTIHALDEFPLFLFSTLVFITLNGIVCIYYAGINFAVSVKNGIYAGNATLPVLNIYGLNLILLTLILLLSIVIRHINL